VASLPVIRSHFRRPGRAFRRPGPCSNRPRPLKGCEALGPAIDLASRFAQALDQLNVAGTPYSGIPGRRAAGSEHIRPLVQSKRHFSPHFFPPPLPLIWEAGRPPPPEAQTTGIALPSIQGRSLFGP